MQQMLASICLEWRPANDESTTPVPNAAYGRADGSTRQIRRQHDGSHEPYRGGWYRISVAHRAAHN